MLKQKRLPELKVVLSRIPTGEAAPDYDDPESVGMRTKLGGEPNWIQYAAVPNCARCRNPMTFVAQIDSVDHENPRNPLGRPARAEKDYMFCDVGMIYVFFCFPCVTTQSVCQYY